ncbi:MAG: peptidoglycan-binding domain-containing protein [Arenicellales bacterium]
MNARTNKLVAVSAAMVLGLAATAGAMGDTKTPAAPAKTATVKTAHKVARHAPSALVKSIQEALNKDGAKLKTDGYLGKKTRSAIKAFQTAHKLKATGHADKKTREALGLKA